MTGLPPPTKSDIFDQVEATIRVVYEAGLLADRKWGIGRLPMLVPIEWAQRFAVQRVKWQLLELDDLDGTTRHGAAMLRAYDKLDELAIEAGHQPIPPDQWEMIVDGRLVIVVQDIRQTGNVVTGERKCEVWSLDEIASVIRAHPSIAAVKQIIPGATVQPLKPEKSKLDDPLDGLPFS